LKKFRDFWKKKIEPFSNNGDTLGLYIYLPMHLPMIDKPEENFVYLGGLTGLPWLFMKATN